MARLWLPASTKRWQSNDKNGIFSNACSVVGPIPGLPFEPRRHDIRKQLDAHRATLPWADHLVCMDGKTHAEHRRRCTDGTFPNPPYRDLIAKVIAARGTISVERASCKTENIFISTTYVWRCRQSNGNQSPADAAIATFLDFQPMGNGLPIGAITGPHSSGFVNATIANCAARARLLPLVTQIAQLDEALGALDAKIARVPQCAVKNSPSLKCSLV